MYNYLIEFRFRGYAKRYIKETIYEVGRRFRVKGVIKRKVVPHITLFGPFATSDENGVVSTFLSVCKRHRLLPFKLRGFGSFDDRVIYADIVPSGELKTFRKELAEELKKLRKFFIFSRVKTRGISDYEKHYPFHATIAFKDIQKKFNVISQYLKNKEAPHMEQKVLRATLLKKGRILYEYDFLQRRLLTRKEALSKSVWIKTLGLLKNEPYQEKGSINR